MIIVTGGAGFIGSNLLAGLEAAGETRLIVCDRLRDGLKWRNIAKRGLEAIVPPEALLPFIEDHGPAVLGLYHLGAISSTTATDADLVLRTNFDFSVALWRSCARHGIPFIYASSAAVYGDGALGFEDSNDIEKLRALRPLNLYGWSKWLFDGWVLRALARGEAAPPRWAGLRFFNVFGPNEYHKGSMQSLVAKIIAARNPGEKIKLFRSYRGDVADGAQSRDFIYVDDAVAAMLWLKEAGRSAGILNLGTGTARSFADLATATLQAAGDQPAIEYVDMPDSLRDAYQYFTRADMGRLHRLGYPHSFTDLETAISRYVTQFLLTDDPYK